MQQITAQHFSERLRRGAAQARAAGFDALLVAPGPDLAYFADYLPIATTERITLLVVPAEGEPTMIVPVLEHDSAAATRANGAFRIVDWSDGEDEYVPTAALLDASGQYAVSDALWAMHLLGLQQKLPEARFAAFSRALPMLRAVKDADEIDRLAAAGAAADATFEHILGVRFAGRTELEVAADLDRLLREHGHSQVDFTVVGSGPNGANPHHEAGDRTIAEGDMVVLDFGGLMDGYGSDTTRTVHVGEPTDEEHEVFEIVKRAQQAAFEAVAVGIPLQEIDRLARAVIRDAGYGDFFIHRVGHGIGTTTHEPPYLVEGEELPIEAGMCFSIEPGIYLPGRFGVRIEDIVVAAEDGAHRLNNTSRELHLVQ
ncbi:aminopeptidase P family protein [Leifsonia aquatica]|uniref:D-alanyl-D-alanine dipeptidase n=2 Tax=Leifsonia aquatica TaxID=144185 RepID=A0A7W4UVM6_LEIAQ|nr:aminopeptidase P family protein [Leifsonia aquatica]ERK72997.1 putative Xaa-Pro dipeptidase [Leifsonia aquatica ATCC 14665]MBB2967154.1 D-alanyl-D-alanine dipeptidase [Leifsonia aquatica]